MNSRRLIDAPEDRRHIVTAQTRLVKADPNVRFAPKADSPLIALCEECILIWQRGRSVSRAFDRREGVDKEERFGTFAREFLNASL